MKAALYPSSLALLRCLECRGRLTVRQLLEPGSYPQLGPDGSLVCTGCGITYPILAGSPRVVSPALKADLPSRYPHALRCLEGAVPSRSDDTEEAGWKRRTGQSFAYEWEHFGGYRPEWQRNFCDYLKPYRPEDLAGKLVIDIGAGSGRHTLHSARAGADVVAVDIGAAIDVARAQVPDRVLTVQADAEALPFENDTFDFVMSIGVLHHLPDPAKALCRIARLAKPGGVVHVYLYREPEPAWQRALLRFVSFLRHGTTRMPHGLLHLLCYPLAGLLALGAVRPYRALRTRPRGARIARALPLKTYADYPFSVLVNDQFDRLSAPIEHRYRPEQIDRMLQNAGLVDRQVLEHHGWIGTGRRPVS